MINIDTYITMAIDYIHKNPMTFALLLGLFKLLAMKSKNTTDDKILTWLNGWFKKPGE